MQGLQDGAKRPEEKDCTSMCIRAKANEAHAKVPRCTTVSNSWITLLSICCVSANVRLRACSVCRTSRTLQFGVTTVWLPSPTTDASVLIYICPLRDSVWRQKSAAHFTRTGTFLHRVVKLNLSLQSIRFLLFGTKAGSQLPPPPTSLAASKRPRWRQR